MLKFYLLTDFHFMAIFTTFGKQKGDKSTLFPGGVSVKFWNDLLGLAKGKKNSTPTHNCI